MDCIAPVEVNEAMFEIDLDPQLELDFKAIIQQNLTPEFVDLIQELHSKNSAVIASPNDNQSDESDFETIQANINSEFDALIQESNSGNSAVVTPDLEAILQAEITPEFAALIQGMHSQSNSTVSSGELPSPIVNNESEASESEADEPEINKQPSTEPVTLARIHKPIYNLKPNEKIDAAIIAKKLKIVSSSNIYRYVQQFKFDGEILSLATLRKTSPTELINSKKIGKRYYEALTLDTVDINTYTLNYIYKASQLKCHSLSNARSISNYLRVKSTQLDSYFEECLGISFNKFKELTKNNYREQYGKLYGKFNLEKIAELRKSGEQPIIPTATRIDSQIMGPTFIEAPNVQIPVVNYAQLYSFPPVNYLQAPNFSQVQVNQTMPTTFNSTIIYMPVQQTINYMPNVVPFDQAFALQNDYPYPSVNTNEISNSNNSYHFIANNIPNSQDNSFEISAEPISDASYKRLLKSQSDYNKENRLENEAKRTKFDNSVPNYLPLPGKKF